MQKRTTTLKTSSASERLLTLVVKSRDKWVAGNVKYLHRPDQLLLDYDRLPPAYPTLCRNLAAIGLRPRSISYQKSSHHWHVVISLTRKLETGAVFFAQLYLGSDRHREAWNFERYLNGGNDKYVQFLYDESKVEI